MIVEIKNNIDVSKVKEKFQNSISNALLNNEFSKDDLVMKSVQKIIAENFICEVLNIYENIQEFDVVSIINKNLLLIKINEVDNNNSLSEILLTIDKGQNEFKITNVITSIKHI